MSSQPADLSARELSRGNILYLFHHVFLPPELPGGDDSLPESDDALVSVVQICLESFAETVSASSKAMILEARDAMRNLRRLRDHSGHVREDALEQALHHIFSAGSKAAIPVRVNEQNSGLIIRRTEDGAVFESFELSPTNMAVFAARGRLVRLFPAIAIQVPSATLAQEDFRASIASTIAKMSHQIVAEARPDITKAGQLHVEDRDTTSPHIVTELLSSILLGCGDEAPMQCIQKNTREEVFWNSSRLPWRRSPTWLLARVTLQLTFQRMPSLGPETYKKFMVYFLARMLEAARAQGLSSDVLHIMSAKIARRLTKLRNSESGSWIDPVRRVLNQTTKLLDKRWCSLRRNSEQSINLAGLSSLNLDRDGALKASRRLLWASSSEALFWPKVSFKRIRPSQGIASEL